MAVYTLCSCVGCRGPVEELTKNLEMFKGLAQRSDSPNDESIDNCRKIAIQRYIDASIDENASIGTLKSELSTIHKGEVLISREVFNWAVKEAQQQFTKQEDSAIRSMAIVETKPTEPPSLYDSNILNHASLCCCAVTLSRNEVEVHRYFGGDATNKLTQVSVCAENSSEELDRYLIARNGNVIYVAFLSEAKLSEWSKKYNTFEEGKVIFLADIRNILLWLQVLKSKQKKYPLTFFWKKC